jgi:hypothetical protein
MPLHPTAKLSEVVASLVRWSEGGGQSRRRRGSVISNTLQDLQFDAAILERCFGDPQALLAAFQVDLFDGIRLSEPVNLGRFAPEGINIRRAN